MRVGALQDADGSALGIISPLSISQAEERLPLNSRIDQIALKIRDIEIDWRSRVDHVVEGLLRLDEDVVEDAVLGDVGDVDEGELAGPRRVESENLLGFGGRADAGGYEVASLGSGQGRGGLWVMECW